MADKSIVVPFKFKWAILLVMVIACYQCGQSDDDEGSSDLLEDTINHPDSLIDNIILPVPKKDSIVKKYENLSLSISPFKKYECCLDEVRKKEKECCCVNVLNDYKTMFLKDDPGLGELVQKDPILSYCRKLMKREYEDMQNELEGDLPLY